MMRRFKPVPDGGLIWPQMTVAAKPRLLPK
jgi:hypothetical protein